MGTMLIGREQGRVEIHLPHIHVSRLHAQITLQGSRALLQDLRRANGTFVNGRGITTLTTLTVGDRMEVTWSVLRCCTRARRCCRRVGPTTWNWWVGRYRGTSVACRKGGRAYSTRSASSSVPGGSSPAGPEWLGQVHLLAALRAHAGRRGAVLLNGKDLYAHFDALKQTWSWCRRRTCCTDACRWSQALCTRPAAPAPGHQRRDCGLVEQMLETVGLAPSSAHADAAPERRPGQAGQPGQRVALPADACCSSTR